MTAYTAQDQALRLKENIQLIVPGVTVQNGYDTDGYPWLRIAKNADAMFVKIESRGNADRVDGLNAPQLAYSPHQARILRGRDGAVTIQFTITDWEATETVTPTINGVADAAVAFDTNNNTSVAALATAIQAEVNFAPYVASASANSGVLTIVGQPGVQLDVSLAAAGGDSISIAEATTVGPEFEMRDVVLAMTAMLGMKTEVYNKALPIPASYSLSGATRIAVIPSDKIHKLMLSQ